MGNPAVTWADINLLYQFVDSCELTDEAFDAERLDFHVDQQAAVRLHQRRGKSDAGLGVGQLYDPGGYTVDQTSTRRLVSKCDYAGMTKHHKRSSKKHLVLLT